MLARFLILVAMMLFGPLYIEVYLYHPMVALEHEPVAIVPLVAAPLAMFAGFLLLAVDRRVTAVLFGLVCAIEVLVGVAGTAIHLALHAPSLASFATDPKVWLGEPPPLVPLSFAAAGCLGLITVLLPGQRRLDQPPVAIARIFYAMAALCGLVSAVAGAFPEGGAIGLFAVIAALAFGPFGFIAEVGAMLYPLVLPYLPARLRRAT
jgi:hypothetical protein